MPYLSYLSVFCPAAPTENASIYEPTLLESRVRVGPELFKAYLLVCSLARVEATRDSSSLSKLFPSFLPPRALLRSINRAARKIWGTRRGKTKRERVDEEICRCVDTVDEENLSILGLLGATAHLCLSAITASYLRRLLRPPQLCPQHTTDSERGLNMTRHLSIPIEGRNQQRL